MIRLEHVRIGGRTTDDLRFGGEIPFGVGWQIVTARNAFGKSTAATAIAWCLGMEPTLGYTPGDAGAFPDAARFRIQLEGSEHPVASSYSELSIMTENGRRLRLRRPI